LGGKKEKKENKKSKMGGGKLLMILAILAMAATTLVMATQARATELDGLKQACVKIGWGACEDYLTGKGSMQDCCRILFILHSRECQCFAMESISNNIPSVDREAALELPKKCGTLDDGCSMIMMPYM